MDNGININELFQNAGAEGNLSGASMSVLNVNDIGVQILDAMGAHLDDIPVSEMVLVTMMVDDSGSIRFSNNSKLVRDGHNMVIEALEKTQQKDNILAHTRYLNGHILFPYSPVTHAVKMNCKNYNPNLGTPLYDQTVVVLGTVLAKTQSFLDNGIPARSVTLILTDGEDAHSVRSGTREVSTIVKDMLRTENHIIAAMGVDNGAADFRRVFTDMGIEQQWILTPGNSKNEIRRAFHLFSQSVVRASQPGAAFSQVSLGGFGN